MGITLEQAIETVKTIGLIDLPLRMVIDLLEEVDESSEYRGFCAGELAGIAECTDNPFGE